MASIIRIKRSSVSGNPGTLGAGELAYSHLSDNGSNGGDRLYIGMGTETAGNAANHVVIGGKFFTDRLDHTAGTLTASSAIVVDSNSKIDQLNVDNLTLNGNTISSTNTDGNIVLTPDGDGYVTISGTNALVIPKGTSAQQAPAVTAAIRFNTDNTAFEGYNGTNWTSLGGVKSVDQNTYVNALNDGTINFYSDEVNVVTVNGDGIDIKTTTATTSDGTTGALKVAGGASIQGNLFVGGNLYGIDEVSSDSYLAANGNPTGTGTTGYSFQSDTGYDTGMFSVSDGILSLYTNNDEILHLAGRATATLNADTLLFGSGGYANEGNAAQIAWNGEDNGLKFYTRYGDQETISPIADGNYLLLQSTNTSSDANAGRSSLRWHDYDVSKYSQVDAQYDGVWIKNAQWDGSSVAQYWQFDLDGKIAFPDINTAVSGASYSKLWAQDNNEFVLNPNTDTNSSALHVASWLTNGNINLYNSGDTGLTLGNADAGDSFIDLGGSDTSYNTSSPDDITIRAARNGKLYLAANNNDIQLANDYGIVTFLNSNGHLQIPGTIETTSSTGDVTLIASDGTDKALVFNQYGYLSLPNTGIQFKDSNNIGGNTKGELAFDGNDIYLDSYAGNVTIYANDDAGWTFNYNSGTPYLQLPNGAHLLDTGNNSILFGFGVQETGSSQRIAIGYQSDTQTGQSWDGIAIGSRAGTTNQGNNAIAMGNRAGNSGQGADAIAIGSSPNSSVGGAGYLNQGQYSIALGAQAGEDTQSNNSIAIGYQAAQTTQGYKSVAIGDNAGNDNQGFLSVAIGANAGLTSQANSAVAVGHSAGRVNQSADATAIGNIAGENDQGFGAVAVGQRAGETSQGQNSVAIGSYAGNSNQSLTAIAIGENAADTNQGFSAIALGRWAGEDTQGQKAIAIGRLAGRYNQSGWAVAIGHHAGMGISGTSFQGTNAIAIGAHAGEYSQHDNSIVLQATASGNGTGINPNDAGLWIDPIRNYNAGSQYVIYNSDTKEVTYNATNIEIDGSTIQSTIASGDADIILEPLGDGTVDVSGARITGVASPSNATDAANRAYVDSKITGLTWKDSVNLLSDEDVPLTGSGSTLTIDSHATLTASNNGYRILLINQDTATENGIYVYDQAGGTYTLTRSVDTDTYQELIGMAVYVLEGTNYGRTAWVQSNHYITSFADQEYVQFAGAGAYTAGDGLSQSGVTFSVNVAASGGIEIVDDNLQLKSSLAGNGLTYADGVLAVGGTTNRISVGSDSIDISDNYVGQTSITTLGTITTGTWQGNAIADTYVANDLTIVAGTVDNTPIGSTTRSSGKFTTLAANDLVTFTNTTEAGPLGTGSVVLSGGLSVAKKIYVGGNLTGAGADTSVLSGFDIDGGTY